LNEAKDTYYTLKDRGCKAHFYVGAAWGKMDDAFLVEWMIKEKIDWKLNVQVHKYIWDPNERGV
jgi:7-carboxy-7-deazaguanine synthase